VIPKVSILNQEQLQEKQNANFVSSMRGVMIALSILSMATVAVTVAVTGIFPLYQKLNIELEKGIDSSAHANAQTLSQYLDRILDISKQIASQTAIRNKTYAYAKGRLGLQQTRSEIAATYHEALNANLEAVGARRIDRNGAMLARTGINLRPEDIHPYSGKQGRPDILGIRTYNGEPHVLVCMPIIKDNEAVGSDLILFGTKDIKDILDSSRVMKGAHAKFATFILVNDGKVYQASFKGTGRIDEDIDWEEIINVVISANLSDSFRHSGVIEKEFNGRLHLLSLVRTDNTPWVLGVLTDKEFLQEELAEQLFLIITSIIVLIILGAGAMLLMLKPVTRRLTEHAKELENRVAEKTSALKEELEEHKRTGSALKESSRILKEKTRALERSNAELDQFAYVVSHDLKAPLRAISNISTWLEDDLGDGLDEENREHLGLLRNRVLRMEALIEGILEYSRIGRVKDEQEEVDMGKMVNEIIEDISSIRDFKTHLPGKWPVLKTEKIRLQQVLENIIGNAIKYNDKEKPELTIDVDDRGSFYEFTISDNGPGIEKEYYDKIFKIFQTLHSKDKVESTGIGLTIVRKIVDEIGGDISVVSELGKGSSFIVKWPK